MNEQRYTQETWERYIMTAAVRLVETIENRDAYTRRGQRHMYKPTVNFWKRRIAFLEANRPN